MDYFCSNECLIECSYEGCNFRVSQFQDILLHMTNNHDINLRNTIRRMEALAGRSVEPQKCRICEAVFKGVSEIQVTAAFNTRNRTDDTNARCTSRITTLTSTRLSVTSVATGPLMGRGWRGTSCVTSQTGPGSIAISASKSSETRSAWERTKTWSTRWILL